MSTNDELLNKLKEFLSEDEIKVGIEKGLIKMDVEKSLDEKTMDRMPLTTKEGGLESGTGSINLTTAGPISWEMVKTTMMKALDAMEKAQNGMKEYVEKADYKDEEAKEMEKAYDKMNTSANQMKEKMKMYKAKLKMDKSLDNDDLDRIEKAIDSKMQDLVSKNGDLEKMNKSLVEQHDNLEKTNKALLAQQENFEKSFTALTDRLSKMQEDLKKMGDETPAPKSVNLKAYIEKGGVKGEDGKKIYHIGIHKPQIINELEKARSGASDIEKAQIDEDILNLSSANIAPSEASAKLLFDKHDVKLVK